MTLTYIARLAKVKVDPHAKDEGRRSNSSAKRVVTDRRTDRRTDGRYQVHYLPRFAVDKNITAATNKGGMYDLHASL